MIERKRTWWLIPGAAFAILGCKGEFVGDYVGHIDPTKGNSNVAQYQGSQQATYSADLDLNGDHTFELSEAEGSGSGDKTTGKWRVEGGNVVLYDMASPQAPSDPNGPQEQRLLASDDGKKLTQDLSQYPADEQADQMVFEKR